jgi:L-lactate dehydrogenase
MQRGLANELVMVDINKARAEGETMDLNHGMAFVRPMRIVAGDYADLADAEVIVLCAGINQHPGQSRLDLLKTNAAIFTEIVPKITAVTRDAILIVATNPVDILTQISAKLAGFAPGRVFGSGTTLDTARLRFLLGRHYEVDPHSIHAYVVGEHGDSELPLWSLANIAGVRLRDFAGANNQIYDDCALDAIFQQVRAAAAQIIEKKKASYYAIGLALVSIVEAVLRDQNTVMTVSSPFSGQYDVRDIALSMPSIVGGRGVERVLDMPLSDAESAAFHASAETLKQSLRSVGEKS